MLRNISKIIVVLLFSPVFLLAQENISTDKMSFSGQVFDAQTKAALPFVNIVFEGKKRFGTTTDIDGNFSFSTRDSIKKIVFTYMGYIRKEVSLSEIKDISKIRLALRSDTYKLANVDVYSKENPAHRIIKKAVKNRKKNRPESYDSYRYSSYNKMFFTYDVRLCTQEDTINSEDIVFGDVLSKQDSNILEMNQFKENNYLFITEAITEKKYKRPGRENERVLASRVSGLKTPLFALIGTQLQSFSIYTDYFDLGGTSYLSPLARNSHTKYVFILKDTLITPLLDTCFTIAFLPKRNKNFDGMKGRLLINTRGYAIQNFIAEPAKDDSLLDIVIRQKYELLQDSLWFPIQLDADYTLRTGSLGSETTIEEKNGEKTVKKNDLQGDLLGRAKSYIRNIRLNEKIKNREFSHVAVSYAPDFDKKDSTFWDTYREDSLTKRERNTYHLIDSIGDELNFENKLRWFHYFTTGKIPLGWVDLDINRLMSYNRATGFSLGLGLTTNYKVSENNEWSGYFSYGFKDVRWKYGLSYRYNIRDHYDSNFKIELFDDLSEIGEIPFMDEGTSLFDTRNIRPFLRKHMYYNKVLRPSLELRFLYYLKTRFYASYSEVYKLTNPYYFIDPVASSQQRFLELGFQMKYAFREKYIETPLGFQTVKTKFPVLFLNYAQNVESPWDKYSTSSSFSYKKLWGKLEKDFKIRNVGVSSFSLQAGKAWGDMPYYKLFHGRGNYSDFGIESEKSFGTMRFNEFMSDEFVYLFYRHQFGSLLFKTEKFAPELSVVHNMGWSRLNKTYTTSGFELKDMHKIYYESGIVVDKLFSFGFVEYGLAVYYRYGPYAFDNVKNNFAFKMSLMFSFQ